MAGFDVDTSSYPKASLPVNPLEVAGKVGQLYQQQQNLQRGAVELDSEKLALVNNRYKAISSQIAALANDPNLTPDKVVQTFNSQLKSGVIDQNMYNQEVGEMPKDPSQLKPWLEDRLMRGQEIMNAINFQYGQPGMMNTGNAQQPVVQSPRFGVRSTGLPIATQPPPTQTEYDENNKPRFRGVQPAQAAPGMVTAPPPKPGLPVASPASPVKTTGPTGPTIDRTPETPTSFDNRFAGAYDKPRGAAAGPEPMFDEGKTQYSKDIELATQKLTNIKPALLALDLIPGLRTGPGTETWNKAVAALKANGIIPTEVKNDPTAIYQEVDKYLHQYLKGRGDRSDADLIAAEKASPNPGTQINSALLKLAQTAVAQDRIEAARALSYKDKNYANYPQYRGSFPASMDERAFIVDKMTPEQKQDLAKEIAKMTPAQKERFIKSLKVYEDTIGRMQ